MDPVNCVPIIYGQTLSPVLVSPRQLKEEERLSSGFAFQVFSLAWARTPSPAYLFGKLSFLSLSLSLSFKIYLLVYLLFIQYSSFT